AMLHPGYGPEKAKLNRRTADHDHEGNTRVSPSENALYAALPFAGRETRTRVLLPAIRQVLVGDRKDAVLLDVQIAHDAGPAGLAGEPDVITARRNSGDPQPLVVIDRSVRIVRALVGAPAVLARRRELQVRHCRGGEIPEANAFALAIRGEARL